MEIRLPSALGYSAAFVRGPRSVGNTNAVEDAAAVVVKQSFTVASGALVPDAAGETLTLTDVVHVKEDDNTPWVTRESDFVVAKHHGDIIVLGARDDDRGGKVMVGGSVRLQRIAGPSDDYDRAQNLFGWHPRSAANRVADARMVVPGKTSAATDRYDRFNNAQRRESENVMTPVTTALPVAAQIVVTQTRLAGETADPEVMRFTYALPPPVLTLLVHDGHCPDRETRWCTRALGALTLDTLVLRPQQQTASAVWRRSWRWGDPGADTLRRAVIAEGSV